MDNAGVYVPLVTPLNRHRSVCRASTVSLINMSREFVAGYVPCLTSGEGWLLSPRQWAAMLGATREAAPNHRVIAGIERPTTDEVVEYAEVAARLGADGIMVTSPFGANITQDAIYAHYKKVHDSTGLDIYIYNEVELSKNAIHPRTLIKICTLPRVVGIKESTNSETIVPALAEVRAHEVAVFQGWENRIVGNSDGNICSLSNLYPEVCALAVNSTSPELTERVNALCDAHHLFEPDWYRHIKNRLHREGVISTDLTVMDSPLEVIA